MKIVEKCNCSLTESQQGNIEMKFAFIDEKGNTISPFCKCKDYFNDIFWSNKVGKSVNIYGLKWKPNQDNGVLDKDRLNLAIKFCKRGDGEKIAIDKDKISGLDKFFKIVTKKLKFEKTKFSVSDDNMYIIVDYDRSWTLIPYLNSAFFMFLRLGINFKGKDIIEYYEKGEAEKFISPHDIGYFQSSINKIKDILQGKLDNTQTYEQYTNSDIHDRSGIVNYKDYKII